MTDDPSKTPKEAAEPEAAPPPPAPPPKAAPADKALQEAHETLQRAAAALETSLERQKQLRLWGTLLVLAILVEVVTFLVASYSTVKRNFAVEKVQVALVNHAPDMLSELSQAMVETASAVVPVYVDEIQVQSVESMPELAMALDKELAALSESTTQKVLDQLHGTLESVHTRQEAELRKQFPDLTEEEAQLLAEELLGGLEMEVEELAQYILDVTIHDIVALKQTMEKFPSKNLPNDEHELGRLFVHHLLMVLDEEIMAMPLEKPQEGGDEA